ncbi:MULTISPECIES: hypothetical protein [unclassified Variovorax]|uniref:hypothetical protein n=1 Tax=unclassified Variovorax TaxID=663243 RepID=UPI001BD39C96|nr:MULTISPECIES: hypothetical protein [unclassified Variovorax]
MKFPEQPTGAPRKNSGSALPLRRFATGVLAAIGLCGANASMAQTTYFTEGTRTIAKLGVQGNQAYIGFVEALTANCKWGYLYIAPDRKVMYAEFLAAKIANKKVSRVDYSQPGGTGTQCVAEIVELSE